MTTHGEASGVLCRTCLWSASGPHSYDAAEEHMSETGHLTAGHYVPLEPMPEIIEGEIRSLGPTLVERLASADLGGAVGTTEGDE